MIQLTKYPPPDSITSTAFWLVSNAAHAITAHAIMVGYMRCIRRLYQLSNRPHRDEQNNVYPEIKKNNASPIAPPVQIILYLGYKTSM